MYPSQTIVSCFDIHEDSFLFPFCFRISFSTAIGAILRNYFLASAVPRVAPGTVDAEATSREDPWRYLDQKSRRICE
jgi:hypothetical protein